MNAELNENISDSDWDAIMKANEQSRKYWLRDMVENKIPFNADKMFEALKDEAVKSVNVTVLKPGEIVSVDGKRMRVARINSETGEPIYEELLEEEN